MSRCTGLCRFSGRIFRKNGGHEAPNDEKRHKIQNESLEYRVKLFHDPALKRMALFAYGVNPHFVFLENHIGLSFNLSDVFFVKLSKIFRL